MIDLKYLVKWKMLRQEKIHSQTCNGHSAFATESYRTGYLCKINAPYIQIPIIWIHQLHSVFRLSLNLATCKALEVKYD